MAKFPVDAPSDRVLRAFRALDRGVRPGNHISLARTEPDGSVTPMTVPGHRSIKAATLRTILTQSGISRDDFLRVYQDVRVIRDSTNRLAMRSSELLRASR